MNDECKKVILISVGFLSFCLNLGLAIAGGVILKDTNNLYSDGGAMQSAWICTLVLTILSGMAALASATTCCGLVETKKEDKNAECEHFLNTASLGVTIWAFIIWFEDLNLDQFKTEYHSLYILMQIRVYLALIILSIIAFVLVVGCGYMCYTLIKRDNPKYDNNVNNEQNNQDPENPIITTQSTHDCTISEI